MKRERPILFSGAMVRAILAGAKTQTRRIVKEHRPCRDGCVVAAHGRCERACPYVLGGHLWVRETHRFIPWKPEGSRESVEYRADHLAWAESDRATWREQQNRKDRWRPSIHMPRWASRITLEVVSVRVERLQSISDADVQAEGVRPTPAEMQGDAPYYVQRQYAFRRLWDAIHGAGAWDANPWVWAIEFKRAPGSVSA